MNTLNEAFNNVSERLGDSNRSRSTDVNSMNTLSNTDKQFKFQEVTVEFVKNKLLNIDCRKAVGIDGLHPKLLKLAAEYISVPISFLFNCSLQSSCIPMYYRHCRLFAR